MEIGIVNIGNTSGQYGIWLDLYWNGKQCSGGSDEVDNVFVADV